MTKRTVLITGIAVVCGVAGFAVGFNRGIARQIEKGSAGNLAVTLHYLALLKTNDLEKLERDLKFVIYANVETQKRFGGFFTNGMNADQLARWQVASSIHSEMSTQVVTITPWQMMNEINSESTADGSVK